MAQRQYVGIKFRPGDTRTYTYHNDGPPVAVGDTVKINGRDGWKAHEVHSATFDKPAFDTKPIMLPGEDARAEPRLGFGDMNTEGWNN